jgi:hypothetical protein
MWYAILMIMVAMVIAYNIPRVCEWILDFWYSWPFEQ